MAEKKILIVDDEEDLLRTLEARLSTKGYHIWKAANGRDAILLAKTKHPDLIILDVVMPGMDGGQVANILKDDPETKDIPIIFLTALVTKKEEEKKSGEPIGGRYFIAKPYNPEDLLKEVEKRLQ